MSATPKVASDSTVPGLVAITGAARGVGRGVAFNLLASGWTVAVLDNDEAALADLVRDAPSSDRLHTWIGDAANREDDERFLNEATASLGPLVALINNAIWVARGPFRELTADEFARTMDVSLGSYFHCMQIAAELMIPHNYGRIINMSAATAELAFPEASSYSAAKGGVNALSRAVALELAPFGICVNTLTSGPIVTSGFTKITGSDEGSRRRLRRVPMRRFGTPDDLRGVIDYLLSASASWTTGAVFHVDGGATSTALVSNTE